MADPGADRDPLEVLAEEFLDRRRRGDHPAVDDYLARCPERREEFRDLLSALELVEDLRPDPDTTGSLPGPGSPRPGRSPSDRLGDFRILREVGRGGMGVVYEAEQESLGRRVALKVLAPWAKADAQQIQRFLREARSAAQLHHPHIVPIIGVGEDDGLHYYAMQFIRGLGLDQVLDEVRYLKGRPPDGLRPGDGRRGADDASATLVAASSDLLAGGTTPLIRRPGPASDPAAGPGPPRDDGASIPLPGCDEVGAKEDTDSRYTCAVARLCVDVASALQYAHDRGMLHRDIKPSNLLLDEQGKVWVTDFGLVKEAGGDDLTATGDLVGTLRYMAPERFRGRCDARSDVYSLGLTLYEMLAFRPAFEAPDRHRLIHQITQAAPQALSRLVPGLPRDLETIIHTAIARDPADRYASAGLLAADLRSWLRNEPIRARPFGLHERLAKWARRNPAIAALGAVSALAVATALIVLAVGYAQVTSTLHRERRTSYFQRIALAERAWSGNDVSRAESLLDEAPEDFRGWEWRYLKRLCHAELLTLRVHPGLQPNAIAFSPDGLTAATSGEGGTIAIREVPSGRVVRTLAGHEGGVYGLAFHPEGTAIASAGQDRTVRIWDVRDGRLLGSDFVELGREALGVAFSPDGSMLASCAGVFWETAVRRGQAGELTLRDARSGRPLLTLPGHSGSVHHVAFDPRGGRLASAGGDGAVKVWDASTGEAVLDLRGHDGVVMGLDYDTDGLRLASAGLDGTLRVWDPSTGAPILTIRETGESFLAVAFSPDGRRLAAAGRSWAVTTWDAATGHRLETYRGHDREVMGVAFSPDGLRLTSAGFDGLVRIWDATRGQDSLRMNGVAQAVRALALDQKGRRLATADGIGPARLWDPATGREALALDPGAGPHSSVAISPDGSVLAAGGRRSGDVDLWDAATGRRLRTLKGEPGRVSAIAFQPGGRLLAAGGQDGAIRTWDVPTGRPRSSHAGPSQPITGLAFRAGGRHLAASTGDVERIETPGEVSILDVETGRVVRRLRGHERGISDLAYSPDGRSLATAGWDGTVRIWDASTGAPVHSLAIRGLLVWAVAFSPDGRRVVAADNIGRMTFWDAASGQEVLTLRGHPDRIYDLAFSADGRLLASAGRDATARVWDATPVAPARGHGPR